MRVLLTGASGAVGRELLKMLIQEPGMDVTVFDIYSRPTASFFRQFRGKIRIIYGDLSAPGDVAPASQNQDIVIHLAAIIPPKADQMPELAHKVNVAGTNNLLRALEKNSRDSFFIYSSSVSVYGDRLKNPDITAGDPLNPSPRDEYARTKIQAESLIRNSNLEWSIFRLSAIMGAGNHKISPLMFHMPLDTPMEITTPEDTARAFISAITKKDKLSGKIFNLGGGESCRITYREFLSRSFSEYGLGAVDFPEHSFAEKNFHCGYYKDGGELEKILKFRRDNIQSYFRKVRKAIPPIQKFLTRIFKIPIKIFLLKNSEPYAAFRQNTQSEINYFF